MSVFFVSLTLMFSSGAVFAGEISIVRNSKAAARLVVPNEILPAVTFAAEELQYHIHKSTGAKLQICQENEIRDFNGPFVFLGDCDATARAGYDLIWRKTTDEPFNGVVFGSGCCPDDLKCQGSR